MSLDQDRANAFLDRLVKAISRTVRQEHTTRQEAKVERSRIGPKDMASLAHRREVVAGYGNHGQDYPARVLAGKVPRINRHDTPQIMDYMHNSGVGEYSRRRTRGNRQ